MKIKLISKNEKVIGFKEVEKIKDKPPGVIKFGNRFFVYVGAGYSTKEESYFLYKETSIVDCSEEESPF